MNYYVYTHFNESNCRVQSKKSSPLKQPQIIPLGAEKYDSDDVNMEMERDVR